MKKRGSKARGARLAVVLAAGAPTAPGGVAAAADFAADFAAEAAVETLLVTAERPAPAAPVSETQYEIRSGEAEAFAPLNAADLLRRLPAVHAVANSRGERLVYLRSAGERQAAAFFDGALLNVPWDNRYDLGLLPPAVIARAATASGALSPQYGVNALGAVAFYPPAPPAAGTQGVLDLRLGADGEREGQGVISGRAGRLGLLAAGGAFRRDGDPTPRGADLEFHQYSDGLRTNTDRESRNALLRGELSLERAAVAATFLYTDGSRGVAPEGDRADARFWRYPQARTIMGVLSGDAEIGVRGSLDAALWAQSFSQTIDSFTDAAYDEREARQEDDDLTFGARGVFSTAIGGLGLSLSANYLFSEHDQTDTDFTAAGAPVAERQRYRQEAGSLGLDADYGLTDRLELELGAGVDRVDYIETGLFPAPDPFLEPVLRAGAAFQWREGVRLRAALGRKSRMPTMRELFGAALNRFLVNPDLRPEAVRTAELAVDAVTARADLSVVLFGQDVTDTIDQRRVGGLRQRINLEGSTVAGVELAGRAALADRLTLAGNLTAMRARRKAGPGAVTNGTTDRLAERPAVLARLALDYEAPRGLRAGAEALYTGRAFSLGPDGDLVRLNDAVTVNVSAGYAVAATAPADLEVYVAARNLFDATLFDQAGLPAPGRSLVGGVRLRF